MKKRYIICSAIILILISLSLLYVRHVSAQSCSTQLLTLCTSGTMNTTGPVSVTVQSGTPLFQITNGICPNGQTTKPYDCVPSTINGTGPYTWSILSGSIPSGTSLNTSTGEVSGTATTIQVVSWQWKVVDFNGNIATQFQNNINIINGIPTLIINSVTCGSGQVGVVYNCQGTATGGTGIGYTWTTIPSPAFDACSINSGSGLITCTPASSGIKNFTMKVVDSGANQATQSESPNIIPAPPICSVAISPSTPSNLIVNTTIQFTATTTNCTPSTVTWSVNGINGGNSTFGTVTINGLYTAPAIVPTPATFNVTATSNADPTKSASSQVTIMTNMAMGQDTYCLPGDIPQFPSDSFAPALTSCIHTGLDTWKFNGTVRTVNNITDWNTQWAAAVCGDIIQLTAGITISNVTIPTKTCNAANPILVRTSGFASLPLEAHRISPCYAGVASLPGYPNFHCPFVTNVMAKINTITQSPGAVAITISANTAFVRFLGIEVTGIGIPTAAVSKLVDNSAGGIHHIVWDRCWFHGTGANEFTRAFNIDHSSFHAHIYSVFTDFLCIAVSGTCTDAQAISGGINQNSLETDQAFKQVGNFWEGAAETIELGGGGAVITPRNVETRLNWSFKPLTWNPSDPSYAGGIGTSGHAPIVKNHYESKNVNGWFIEGNVEQNNWGGFSQSGPMNDFTPKSQSNACPTCEVLGVIMRYNYITTGGQPWQFANIQSDTGGNAFAGMNYSIHDNVVDNMNYATCNACGTSASPYEFTTSTNAASSFVQNHINFSNNTLVQPLGAPSISSNFGLSGPGTASGLVMNNLIHNNNIELQQGSSTNAAFGNCGTAGLNNCACGSNFQSLTQGVAMINACYVPNTFQGNVFIGANSAKNWPSGTCITETTQTNMYVNWNNGLGGDYHVNPASSCAHAGVGGTTPGANIDLVNQNISGVATF